MRALEAILAHGYPDTVTKPDLPLLTFADAAAFERWLDAHEATAPGA